MSARMAGILDEIAAFLQKEQAPNPQLAGRHPSDNADMSALQLAPYMAKGLINDVARYGKQAVTGQVSDTELLPQQPLTGNAKSIADAAGSAMGTALNYQVPSLLRGPRSAMDDINMVVDAYQGVRPGIVDAIGEPSVNRVEGAGLLGSMFIPGKAGKIKAYHGSPHDFDRFSSDNIGTGEGAQAYGHGLYFAEREGTALSYRDSLTPRDFDYEEYLMDQYKAAESMDDYNRMDMLERAMQHDTPADFRDIASDADYDDDYRQLAADMADEMEGFVNPNGKPVNFGRMYEVDINASPDELLDYDLPLNTQSPKIQKSIDDLMKSRGVESYVRDGGDGAETIYIGTGLGGLNTGSEILKTLSGKRGPSGASKILKDVGIKGIKYADAQTRFSPKGRTNNYVIFDDKTIEIARKYGVSMPVAGAILAGTMTPEEAQASEQQNRRGLLSNLQ